MTAFSLSSNVLTIASSVYTGVGIVYNLSMALANGEVDSPEDFFNLVFGGGTDAANEEINRKLDDILDAVNALSEQLDDVAQDLKQQIDAQTGLLVNVDVSQLVASISSNRAQLSSYDPNAGPGEAGYVAPEDLVDYGRGFTERADELLQQLAGIANTVLTESDGYTPNIDIIISTANALAYAVEYRMQVAGRFERDELAADRLTVGLDAAASFFERTADLVRDLFFVNVELEYQRIPPEGQGSATMTGDFYNVATLKPGFDGITEEVDFTYSYFDSIVTTSFSGEGGFRATNQRDPAEALTDAIERGVINLDYEARQITGNGDANYAFLNPQGGGGYFATIADVMLTVDASDLPQFVDDTMDQEIESFNLGSSAERAAAKDALSVIARYELLERLGVTYQDDGTEVNAYRDFAAFLRSLTSGIEDRTPGDDGSLSGTEGKDLLFGDSGANLIQGGGENDTLRGREGNDTIEGGAGNDSIKGDLGDDLLDGGAGTNFLLGHEGNDTLRASGGSRMEGGVGDDLIEGGAGRDIALGGDGQDSLHGGDGNDALSGDAGNDRLKGDGGNDILLGGAGNDSLDGGFGYDTLDGGDGTDEVSYAFYNGDTTLSLETGVVYFNADPSVTETVLNVESVIGSGGRNNLTGNAEHNHLVGADRPDRLLGADGNDTLDGFAGPDFLFGGADDDLLNGHSGDDTVSGGSGTDTLAGGTGNDSVLGGDDDDVITGDAGQDFLQGGAGDDTMSGGDGTDTAEFSVLSADATVVHVPDGLQITSADGVDVVHNDVEMFQFSDRMMSYGDVAAMSDPVERVYRFALDGGQANAGAGTGSAATGTGLGVYDPGTGELAYRLTVSGLDFGTTVSGFPTRQTADTADDVLVAHIHNAPRGTNGAVVFNFLVEDDLTATLNPDGSWTLSGVWDADENIAPFAPTFGTAAPGTELDLYFNIHTTAFTGGEIRGQIVSAADDTPNSVTGTAGDDTLLGLGGNDTLDGQAGEDEIDGGGDNDSLTGGDGNDTLDGQSGDDVLEGDAGNDFMTGKDGADDISGGDGFDWIVPGTGIDTVDGGAGRDMVSYSDLPANPGRGVALMLDLDLGAGTAEIFGGEVDQITNFERATGTIFADVMRGSDGYDELRGLGDYDWFIATDGQDTIDGGNGQDMITFLEWGGSGAPVVLDIFSDAGAPPAPAAVGGILLDLANPASATGYAAGLDMTSIERVTGSSYQDVFYGDANQNDFRGLGGYDWFVGSTGGRERYYGGEGIDTVTYFQSSTGVIASLRNGAGEFNGQETGYGSGGDAIRDLYFEIENLVGTQHRDRLEGNSERNQLAGLGDDDFLYGYGGIDYIEGGEGNDYIDGGAASDYALYDGTLSEYTITRTSATDVTITGRGYTDTLTNVEYFQFDDATANIWEQTIV
ncbi:Ca2+-binding protein, RTX toxin-related [Palleronia salina]|uniref:Ca2+-binding protein, RTX toxin-related n=1 Tax=Palleronia salina TaxID=313368 RepID=A0A1M6ID00_9RHOB|nr:Ca2+-binding protein, RTX toxin-related [Palleronia salina]